jgi:acetyl esterase/lipase
LDRVYLALALAGLALTINAWHPLRRPAVLGALSFFAGWFTAELALHHIALQAAVTAWFATEGAFATPAGQAGLGLSVLSWVGLATLLRPAATTRRVILDAVDEAYGPRDRAGQPTRDLLRLLWPFRYGDAQVERIRNIVYAEVGKVRLRLDVFRPREPGHDRPVLLHIHGGGWVIGSKDTQGLPLMRRLAAEGWVVVNANYRLSPRATFPDHLIDIKRAIAWVRAHAADHGGSPDSIIIAGLSAGAHLASLAALTPNRPELQPGFEDVDTRLAGCVSMYGVYDVQGPRPRLAPRRDGDPDAPGRAQVDTEGKPSAVGARLAAGPGRPAGAALSHRPRQPRLDGAGQAGAPLSRRAAAGRTRLARRLRRAAGRAARLRHLLLAPDQPGARRHHGLREHAPGAEHAVVTAKAQRIRRAGPSARAGAGRCAVRWSR